MRELLPYVVMVWFVGIVSSVHADEIGEIREYYDEVMEHLDDEYGLYRTEISVNTEDGIYPAIGNYQETITFYWGAEGGHSSTAGSDG